MKTTFLALGLILSFSCEFNLSAQSIQPKWRINSDNSTIKFRVKNLGMPVDGKFTKLSGTVTYDGKSLSASSVQANVDIGSIDTSIGLRDNHLKSKDFFNIAKFPEAEFRSSKINVKPSGEFQIVGTLSLHGISGPVTLDAKPLQEKVDQSGQNHLFTSASTSLLRKSFDVGGLAAVTVGNDVKIDLAIDLVKD